jgi:hypothetical protein
VAAEAEGVTEGGSAGGSAVVGVTGAGIKEFMVLVLRGSRGSSLLSQLSYSNCRTTEAAQHTHITPKRTD